MSPNNALSGVTGLGETVEQYWSLWMPIFLVHSGLAMATIGLGFTTMMDGDGKLRNGTGVGAMVGGVCRHRRLERMLQLIMAGILLTVYGLLFYWFPAN